MHQPLLPPVIDTKRFISDGVFRRRYLTHAPTVQNYRATNVSLAVTKRFSGTYNSHEISFVAGDRVTAVRQFTYRGTEVCLLVSERTLLHGVVARSIVEKSCIESAHRSSDCDLYHQAFLKCAECHVEKRRKPARRNISIVVDMCQSSSPWDPTIFLELKSIGSEIGIPLAITLAPAGRWIIGHSAAFRQIVQWQQAKVLLIDWANHTMNHAFNTDSRGNKQFLCAADSDLVSETISLEILFLEYGICPSLWFRFPGNKFNYERLLELSSLRLIPLSIDVWLERGEKIRSGSVVLVHANGNDERGVSTLMEFLQDRRSSVLRKEITIQCARNFFNLQPSYISDVDFQTLTEHDARPTSIAS